jgi:hypothetical protein
MISGAAAFRVWAKGRSSRVRRPQYRTPSPHRPSQQLWIRSGISSITAEGATIATQGGLTAAEFAASIGITKSVLDLGTVLDGYYMCATQ